MKTLFDLGSPDLTPLPPTDPNVAPADVARLGAQCEAILKRLKQGPASNKELAKISLKYTSRISDLRKHGYDIECVRSDQYKRGLTVYRLRRGPA